MFGALQVKWDAVTNVDSVTYEVHVSTTSGFTPDRPFSGTSTTRVIQTEGTFAIVKTLPSGVSLNYDTLYYVRIVAKDFDGAAGPSVQASGTPSKVDNGDIAANAVRANQIFAGSVSADKVDSANLLVSKLFSVGAGGTFAIKIDATGDGSTTPYKLYSGFGSYYDSGTAFYLDSLGKFSLKDKLFFDGTNLNVNGAVVAQSGYFNGPITVNGFNPAVAMKIGRNVSGSLDGISLDANNYWYTNGSFRVGSSTLGFSWDGISSFKVTGNIEAREGKFLGAVTIDDVQANAGLWVLGTNATYTAGPRVVINKNGLYAYNFGATTGQAASTYINLAASSGAYTFVTENAQIGGWTVDSNKIEKLTAGLYSGMATGSVPTAIAFYAGSTGSGGNNTAKFSVTQGGAVIARDISILGDGTNNTILQIGGTGNASPFTVDAAGNMKSTSATVTGTINAASGNFTGNVFIGTAGSLVSGTVTLPSTPQAPTSNTNTYPILSSSGYILNKAGMTFSNGLSGVSLRETTIVAATGLFTTNSANIGGWDITPGKISKSGIELNTAITTGVPAITATSGTYYVGITTPTATTTDAILWAGNRDYSGRNTANFRVDATGKLYATGAQISGDVEITSGPTYVALNDKASASSVTTLSNSIAGKANTADVIAKGGAAADVNSNTTKISGGSIRTGVIESTTYTAPSGSIYSGNGMSIVLDNQGSIISKNFVIDSSGNAYFKGSLTGSSGTFGTVTINANGISSTNFTISSTGNVTLKGEINATSGFFGANFNDGFAIIDNAIYGYTAPTGGVPQIVIDAKTGTITGGKITGSIITGNTITGGTITGATVQTSTSTTNVKLQNSGVDSLQVTLSGTVAGHLFGSTAGGGSMILQGGSSAPNSGGNVYGQVYVASSSASIAGSASTRITLDGVGNQMFINASTGIFTGTNNNFYMRSGDTTASNANAFINSSSGLMARSTSSRKYKTDIETVSYSDDSIKSLRPVKYHGIKDMERGDNTWYTGLIAEEVAEIPGLELLVNYNEDGSPEAVNYAGLSVVVASVVSRILERLDKAGI